MEKRDYTKYSFCTTLIVVVMAVAISFIPPFSLFGIDFKRANIISELYTFDDAQAGESDAEIADSDREFISEMENGAKIMIADSSTHTAANTVIRWQLGASGAEVAESVDDEVANSYESDEAFAGVVKIEDYSDGSRPSVADFCALLGTTTQRRVVRLGFLGDSYIEGDIITADVREQLQSMYGGCGVGFVPFSTPLAQNRPTIKHTFGGWKNYNIINKRSASESIQDMFYISGVVSEAKKDTWTRFETTQFRRHLSQVNSIRMIFKNGESNEIQMIVNDTVERKFTPAKSDQLQQINVSGAGIKSVKVVVESPDGFYGYGVVMEGARGISVDNYSVRSNSGLALFGTNSGINMQINRMLGYDMIILQYGLNIMQADVTSYKSYGEQLRRVINYMKACFPRSVIVVFGVGDRSTQQDGEFVSMPAVKGLLAEQRAAAKECGVAFWSIYDAMGGRNSMSRYVEWGWAAKDHTHLSFGGGKRIATQFVKALEYVKAHPSEDSTAGVAMESANTVTSPVERLDSFINIDSDTVEVTMEGSESPIPSIATDSSAVELLDSVRVESAESDLIIDTEQKRDSIANATRDKTIRQPVPKEREEEHDK